MKRIALVLLVAVAGGCVLLPDATVPVTVILPELLRHWVQAFSNCTFALSWPNDEVSASSGNAHHGRRFVPGSRVVVELPRTPPVPLIATPSCGGVALAPAGAVWPLHRVENGALALSFAEGPAAETLIRAADAGADLRTFSVRRFSEAIHEHLPDDPWQLEIPRIAEAIAARAMRESYIRPTDLFPVVGVPPPGVWIARSPFLPAITGESGWPDLPTGVHTFIDGSGKRVYVEVDDEGRSWTSR
jgi:hypothetical protein